jgi:hypothetical protein
MANNLNDSKEQERSELHRAIWQIANDLRGSVDGWDFKLAGTPNTRHFLHVLLN